MTHKIGCVIDVSDHTKHYGTVKWFPSFILVTVIRGITDDFDGAKPLLAANTRTFQIFEATRVENICNVLCHCNSGRNR